MIKERELSYLLKTYIEKKEYSDNNFSRYNYLVKN